MGLFDVFRDPTFVGAQSRTFVTSFSRLKAERRIDANRFDPKYDNLFQRLAQAGSVVRLGDRLRESAKRGIQPTYDANGTIYVINSQQIHADQIDMESCSMTSEELVESQRNKGRIKKYDTLLNSTGYITIGRCQPYLEDVPAIVDSHITILRPKEGLDPVYLAVFLNSRLGYLQTERSWTGSSGQIELRKEAIEDFQILLPDYAVQLAIRQDVEAAYAARAESRRLLQRVIKQLEEPILSQ